MLHDVSFPAAAAVLGQFWKRFNGEMDASAVVWDLVHHQIIPQSVQVDISKESSPKQQNQILHAGLKKSCTEEALMRACDIIIAVEGNPKMRSLGVDMKRYLQSVWPGMCSCVRCVFACIRIYVHNDTVPLMYVRNMGIIIYWHTFSLLSIQDLAKDQSMVIVPRDEVKQLDQKQKQVTLCLLLVY